VKQSYYVYILARARNGTLYIGVTNDIARRAHEHRSGTTKGFTQKYGAHRLVHIEPFADVREAIRREKQLKEWQRKWKLALIEEHNPTWRDLWADILS